MCRDVGNANRAQSLRQLVETDGHIALRRNTGEAEALQVGVDMMDVPAHLTRQHAPWSETIGEPAKSL